MYRASYEGGLKLPELGPLDRACYAVLIAVTLAGAVGGVVGFLILLLVVQYPLTEPNVAGVANAGSVFCILIFGILMGLIVYALVEGRTRKYPIFGAAGVTYGAPEWTPVYPLLMPVKSAPEQVRQAVHQAREIVCFMGAGLVLAAFVFATAVFSGNMLYDDGSVRVLWGPGWEIAHYAPEDVAEIEVVQFRTSGGKSGAGKWRIDVQYKMDDDRLYRFMVCDGAFREDGERSQVELLAQVLDSYPNAKITFYDRGYIPDVVRDQQYSQQDQEILEKLFGVQ